jgi:two-component system NtrC family sensor kinase
MRRRLDQSTFRSTCSVVALKDRAGTLTNFVAVERDTTHEGLFRDQLVRSERLAAVGQLVSGVAHEINNPLQAIVGFTELLIVAERRIETREDLEQVRAAAHRAAKIVRSLLAFVRRAPTERSVVNLNEVLESTVALRRYEITAAGVELEETYDDSLPPVLVNREEIQQILLNLVLNAEQAMRIAGIRGRLSVRTARIGSSDLVIEIRDTGPGVPPAIAGRIFEPFFTTRNVGEGTGLGLSLALGIAEAHGGSLTLLPASPGACFRLTLPVGIIPPTAMPGVAGTAGPVGTMDVDERVLA